jgi:hypothetical protein
MNSISLEQATKVALYVSFFLNPLKISSTRMVLFVRKVIHGWLSSYGWFLFSSRKHAGSHLAVKLNFAEPYFLCTPVSFRLSGGIQPSA